MDRNSAPTVTSTPFEADPQPSVLDSEGVIVVEAFGDFEWSTGRCSNRRGVGRDETSIASPAARLGGRRGQGAPTWISPFSGSPRRDRSSHCRPSARHQ
jgi:hypothetical protein